MANITPTVLGEVNVNIMQHVITHGIYTYLVSKFGVMPAHHHHREREALSATKKTAIKELTAEKKATKRELRQLRRSGSSPEEVRLLATKFHHLVRQHSKLTKEAKTLTCRASAKQMRRECHKDIHRFARRVLDD